MDDGTRFAGFFLGDGEDEPAVFPMEVTANYRFPVHYHKTHYMSIILRGSLRVGKKWYRPGDIRLQEKGSVYGPEEAGPEGCYMLNIFADRRGYFPTLLGEINAGNTTGLSHLLNFFTDFVQQGVSGQHV